MPRKKAKFTTRVQRPRAVKKNPWDVEFVTTSPESRLVDADLIGMLAKPETWAHLTKEEIEEVTAHFPEHVPRNDDGSIAMDFLRYDNDWRHGVRQWQGDLAAGHLNKDWQQQAATAVQERKAGKFDKFKEDEFEEFWGQKQKQTWNMRAGESAVLKLADLIAAGLFKKGDFWVYSKVFGKGAERVEVVKDCKIVGIGETTLSFAVPPGTLRYARQPIKERIPNEGTEGSPINSPSEDMATYAVSNVRMLEDKIVETDGRVTNLHHHNAWKYFRCQRDNQDLGSLFEIREEHYVWKHPH